MTDPAAIEPPGTAPRPGGASAAAGSAAASDVRRLDEIDAELTGVDTALRRLDDGTYGQCEVCGTSLAPDLLEADPLATRCPAHPR